MFIHERFRAISSLLIILFSMYLRALASIVYGITDDCLRKSKFILSTQTFTRLFPLYFPRASKMTDHFVYTHIFICCFLLSWKAKKMFCFVLRKEFLLLLKRVLKRYVYLHIEKYTTCDLWPTLVPVLFFLENLRIALLKALSFTYSYFGSLASLTSLLGNPCFLRISVWRFLSVLKRNRKALSRGWFLWHINFSFLCHFSLFW